VWIGTQNTPTVGERGRDSGDGCCVLEGGNGIGGGGKGLEDANQEKPPPSSEFRIFDSMLSYSFSQIVDSGSYCSPECESLDNDIIIHNVNAMEAPYISRFAGNDSAGIQAWAAEISPGAPDGGLSSKTDIKLCRTPRPKPPDFPTSLVSSLAPIDPPAIEDASGHSGMSFGHPELFSAAPQDPDSFASTDPLVSGGTSGPRSFAPSEQSARMFEQAHDINITGGQFYSATGGINISENSFCCRVR
jgi:hypothetical protein